MKTLYLECAMGAAGDMLMSALSELIPDPEGFVREMNALGLPGVKIERQKAVRAGITGTHMAVTVDGQEEHSSDAEPGHDHHHDHDHDHHHEHDHGHEHHHEHDHGHEHHHDHEHDHEHQHDHEHHHEHGHHHHAALADIEGMIASLPVSDQVKADATAVYKLIAQAEGHAHGMPMEQIHFHEVGTLDAVADVVGVCLLMERIGAGKIACSPVHVGSGQVKCAHGVLPVPAPATAYILKDVPIYGGQVKGELCTPTGAALLKHFAASFGPMPMMRVEKTGYGMGTKEFESANCVRAFLGEAGDGAGQVAVLECNLDDMTGEALGFAMETLLMAGALDVFIAPIQMKKNRPGHLLSVICEEADADRFAALMLRHTTSFGVRKRLCERYTLSREVKTAQSDFGPIQVKEGRGYGVTKSKPEYEDLKHAAVQNGVSLADVAKSIR